MRKLTTLSIGLVAILATACSSAGGSASPAAPGSSAGASVAASVATSSAASVAPSAAASSGAACTKDNLTTATPGKLTVGTDNPAYPPYYAPNAAGKLTAPWKISDPTNGQGFESAVAYAIADRLGFAKADVAWIVVPFANSYAPGPKTFDIDLNQVNYKIERTQTADLSKGYYFGNQALVVLKASPLAKATSVAALKDYVYGAQVGTTSYDAIASVIAPTKKALVYDTNDLAIKSLSNKTIDGIVVDLPTADYITNVQIDNGAAIIAGQFQGGTPEYFSAVLAKGSPLTDCVNKAIEALTQDGTLKDLASTWLPFQDKVPVFTP
jgi:polar amino acid transport system substrate-binding protein